MSCLTFGEVDAASSAYERRFFFAFSPMERRLNQFGKYRSQAILLLFQRGAC